MMNMNDLLGAAKDITGGNDGNANSNDNDNDNANSNAEGNGLSGLMDIAKDFDMETLEKYKTMSKMEILEEIKNSEHSETVINYLKGLLASK